MRNVRPVKVGDCVLDGKHIYIQSMLNARSDDIEGSVKQAKELEAAGCEIIRAAIPNMEAVKLFAPLCRANQEMSNSTSSSKMLFPTRFMNTVPTGSETKQ